MRRLYARKLQRTEAFFESTPGVHIQSSKSGLHMLIRVASRKPAAKLCQEAASLGIRMLPTALTSASVEGAFPAGVTFTAEDLSITLSADRESYNWTQAIAPGDSMDGVWCVGVPATVTVTLLEPTIVRNDGICIAWRASSTRSAGVE